MTHLSHDAFILPSRPGYYAFTAKNVFDDIDSVSEHLGRTLPDLESDLELEKLAKSEKPSAARSQGSTLTSIVFLIFGSLALQSLLGRAIHLIM